MLIIITCILFVPPALFQYILKLFLGQNCNDYNLQMLNKISVSAETHISWH